MRDLHITCLSLDPRSFRARLLAFAVATTLLMLIPTLSAHADGKIIWPDCYCTDSTGARIEMGETQCLRVGGRSYLARCEMSLNNPIWREVSDSCLVS